MTDAFIDARFRSFAPFPPPAPGPDYDVTLRVDGVAAAPFTVSGGVAGLVPFDFGARFPGPSNGIGMDAIKVGTSGYGSSELFSFTGASLVPPFDSLHDDGAGNPYLAAGTLRVDNAGAEAYAEKVLGLDEPNALYVQFRVRLTAAMIAAGAGTFTADFVEVYVAPLDSNYVGVFAYDAGSGSFDTWEGYGTPPGSGFSDLAATISADTWYTVDLGFVKV